MLSRLKSVLFRASFDAAAFTAPSDTLSPPRTVSNGTLGCFWGTQHIFLKHFPPTPAPGKGILRTSVGYTGGNPLVKNPAYKSVCSGATDHAEAVRIEFDPAVVSVGFGIYSFFYRSHDPTTLNRQGLDSGTQYRSAIFTHSPEQIEIARRVTQEVQAERFTRKNRTIATEITPAGAWWDAETNHQLYLFKHPGGYRCPTHRLHW
ncbi:peptide methionine sulfoxide reductase [Mycena belliarum]|uniref:peptide-methionine (S)-S-oxide reductase n=1 Tax=Mycena belliarum TaxID=1033014 RepID=A0AAD6U2F7_9AGAR|nr:peptide methionine sulfoxide reductase [Mycena belliae]